METANIAQVFERCEFLNSRALAYRADNDGSKDALLLQLIKEHSVGAQSLKLLELLLSELAGGLFC